MASLKDALAPTLLAASAVFAAFATPLVFIGERQVTIRMDRDVVYDGIVRDVSLPYIAFSLVVSMGAGLTTMTVAGWSSSTKRNIALENEREALRAELHEKEIQIDELKLSSANLAAAGLDAFLDSAEATPQAPAVIAEMLVDDPFITIEPASAKVAPPVPSQPQAHRPAPKRVEQAEVKADAKITTPAPASPATISGEVLHVYGALQDRFEQAAASQERSPSTSRAYTPAVEAQPPSQIAPAVADLYTALYNHLQTVDLPSPEQRGVAASRAYTPASPLTSNPTHLQAEAPHTYASMSTQFVRPDTSQAQSPAVQPQTVAPSPTAPQPSPERAARPASDTDSAAAAYAILGLDTTPQSAESPVIEPPIVDLELEQLTSLLGNDDPGEIASLGAAPQTSANTLMPWDQWLDATSTVPEDTHALPPALAKLEEWLTPATSNTGDDRPSALSDWDRWLQNQQQPESKRLQNSSLDDWLAAFNASDSAEAKADLFELPLASPDTRTPKVVRFQRGSAHSRKDS